MLRERQGDLFWDGFMPARGQTATGCFGPGLPPAGIRTASSGPADDPPDSSGDAGDGEVPLEDAARSEREYVRQRLREELGREPTDEELDEWLRQHTEGY
jgi:hypothetical protein